VLRADVSLGPDNRSRGYGTVLLATAEDAGRAVDMFNGYSWQTRILEVRLDRVPPDLDLLNPQVTNTSGYQSPTPSVPFRSPPSALPFPQVHHSVTPALVSNPSSYLVAPQVSLGLDEAYDHSSPFGHDLSTSVGTVSRNLFVGNVSLLLGMIHMTVLAL